MNCHTVFALLSLSLLIPFGLHASSGTEELFTNNTGSLSFTGTNTPSATPPPSTSASAEGLSLLASIVPYMSRETLKTLVTAGLSVYFLCSRRCSPRKRAALSPQVLLPSFAACARQAKPSSRLGKLTELSSEIQSFKPFISLAKDEKIILVDILNCSFDHPGSSFTPALLKILREEKDSGANLCNVLSVLASLPSGSSVQNAGGDPLPPVVVPNY